MIEGLCHFGESKQSIILRNDTQPKTISEHARDAVGY